MVLSELRDLFGAPPGIRSMIFWGMCVADLCWSCPSKEAVVRLKAASIHTLAHFRRRQRVLGFVPYTDSE